MPERRIFARHTPTALTYVSAGAANGGILLNVSEAGCALQLISPPPTMSDVNLELDLGSSLPHVEVAGKVMWADDTGCTGIRFNHLSEAARQTIRRFVESTPADPTMHEIGMELDAQLSNSEPGFESAEDPLVAEEAEEPLFDALEPQSLEARLEELSTGAAFVAIVEECRSATGATASALAMLKGRDMLCRASCGKGAPPNGARLDITSERSFTAQCVSTATTLRCVDSQIDPRVNAAVCQRLNIRSVTAMPLMHSGRVVGVLEVFSSERNAFHDGHIAALENLGKIAVEFAIARNEITLPPSQPAATWPAISRPATPRTAERPAMPPISPAQPVSRPASPFGSSFTGATAVAVAPAKESMTSAAATPVAIQQRQVTQAKPEPSLEQKPVTADNASRAAQPLGSASTMASARPASASTTAVAPIFTPAARRPFAPESTEKKPGLQSGPKPAFMSAASRTAASAAPANAPASTQSGSKNAAAVIEAMQASSSSVDSPAFVTPAGKSEPSVREERQAFAFAKPAPQTREPEKITGSRPAQPVAAAVPKPQLKSEKFEIGPLAEDPAAFVGFEYSAGSATKPQTLFQEHTQPASGNRKNVMIAGGAVALLLIAGAGTWQFLRAPASSNPPQTVAAAAPSSAPQQADATNTAAASAASPVSTPDSSSNSASKDSSSKSAKKDSSSSAKSGESADKSEKKDEKKSTGDKEASSEPKVIALAQSERLQQQAAAVAPPTITASSSLPALLTGAPTPSLPSLRVTPPQPAGPLKVSSTAITDHLIRKVDPIYPEMARRSGLSGAVRLRLEIGVDGKVKSATVLEGAAVLAASAKDAVMQWRYRPYVVENKPVPIETEIVVRFTGR